MHTNALNAQAKLEKYRRKVDSNAVYLAAVVLCPDLKWEFLEDTWDADAPLGLQAAQDLVENFWRTDYAYLPIQSVQNVPNSHLQNPVPPQEVWQDKWTSSSRSSINKTKKKPEFEDILDTHFQKHKRPPVLDLSLDEYEQYLRLPQEELEEGDTPMACWVGTIDSSLVLREWQQTSCPYPELRDYSPVRNI